MKQLHALVGAAFVVLLGAVVGVGLLLGAAAGSVTDWIALILAIPSFMVSFVGVCYGYMSIKDQRARDFQQSQARRRAQADKMTAGGTAGMWRASTPTHIQLLREGHVVTEGPGPILLEWQDLFARNASDMPVSEFQFELYVRAKGSDVPFTYAGAHRVGMVMPGDLAFRLTPEPDSELTSTMWEAVDGLHNSNIEPPEYKIGFAFRDHDGVRWRYDLDARRVVEVEGH